MQPADATTQAAGVRQEPLFAFVCSPKRRPHVDAGSAMGAAFLPAREGEQQGLTPKDAERVRLASGTRCGEETSNASRLACLEDQIPRPFAGRIWPAASWTQLVLDRSSAGFL